MVAVFLFEVRRARQLHALLGSICIQAFADQHLPIWGPWGRVYGYALKITIVRVSDKMSDGEA